MLVNDAGRLPLPIIDNSAKMAIYATYLTQDQSQVLPLINQLTETFPAD